MMCVPNNSNISHEHTCIYTKASGTGFVVSPETIEHGTACPAAESAAPTGHPCVRHTRLNFRRITLQNGREKVKKRLSLDQSIRLR